MKKSILFTSILILAFLLISPAFAANGNQGIGANAQGQETTLPSPSGNQVKNQNRVGTQNQGEESQLQVQNQEEESLGTGEGLQTRSQTAIQNMSQVAIHVQELLQIRTSGGIGQEVRLIAQEQNQAQEEIQEQIGKLENKGKFARFLTGTDYGAVKNIKQQLIQNELRIEKLQELLNQLSNQGDIEMVQETIQALIQENTALQEMVAAEEKTFGLFGWLFRLFNN